MFFVLSVLKESKWVVWNNESKQYTEYIENKRGEEQILLLTKQLHLISSALDRDKWKKNKKFCNSHMSVVMRSDLHFFVSNVSNSYNF